MAITRTPLGTALREGRFDLRLNHAQFAELLIVSRATLSRWERGRSLPTYEDRVRVIRQLERVPRQTLERVAAAWGLELAKPAPPPSVNADAREPVDVREVVTAAVRAAADDLDLTAASVRRVLAATLPFLIDGGVERVEEIVAGMRSAPIAKKRARSRVT